MSAAAIFEPMAVLVMTALTALSAKASGVFQERGFQDASRTYGRMMMLSSATAVLVAAML